jgi:DNA-directed RNA polymerase specialized sigma24 family protein
VDRAARARRQAARRPTEALGRSRLEVELAHEARELRSIAGLGRHRRTALTLRAVGYSYKEIQKLLGVTYTWGNRHVTEGRQALRQDDAATVAEAEALRKAA